MGKIEGHVCEIGIIYIALGGVWIREIGKCGV